MNNPSLLSTLNTAAGVMTPDALSRHLTYLKESLRERTRFMSNNSYGIVDSADPRYNGSGVARPLWPVLNSGDYSKVTVYPGSAVTPSGDVVVLSEATTVTLTGISRGSETLVYVQRTEVQTDELALTTDGQTMSVGFEPKTVLSTALLAEYYDGNLFTRDVLDSMVVLGVVIWSDSDVPLLITDGSNGYTWNRPWFSACDIEHRSYVGSGTPTVSNPHGLGLNDLAVGRLKPYDQLTNSGMILSMAKSVPGIPGFICNDTFAPTSIKLDTNGSITKRSWFSRPGRMYVELTATPNVVFRAYAGDQEIAVDWITGTRYVLLCIEERPTLDLTIIYNRTATGSVQKYDNTSIVFAPVADDDIVITNGLAKTTLLRTTVPVRKYGSVPRQLTFHAGANGQVYVDPTIVMSFTEVLQSSNVRYEIDTSIPAPGRVGIALTDMPSNPAATVSFRVEGVGIDGETQEEVLTFDYASWVDAAVPADYEEPKQVHFTSKIYASVDAVTALDTPEYGMDNVGAALFAVLLKQESTHAKTAQLASAFWDGVKLTNVLDERRVLTVVRDGKHGYTSLHQAAEVMPGIDNVLGVGERAQLVVAEDFLQPTVIAADTIDWDGRGELNSPVIDPKLANSDAVERCYRSRQIPLRINPAEWTRLVVILFGADQDYTKKGAVRIVLRRSNGDRAEAVLVPFEDDNTGSLFVGFVNGSWESVAYVVSGRCRGFASYFVHPTDINPLYVVETL